MVAAKADIHNHGREQNCARNSTYKTRQWILQCPIISLIILSNFTGLDLSEMLMHMSFHIWTNLSSLPRWFSNSLARVKMVTSSCVSMSESMMMAYPQTSHPSLEVCSCAMRFLKISSVLSYTTSRGRSNRLFVLSYFITDVLPS